MDKELDIKKKDIQFKEGISVTYMNIHAEIQCSVNILRKIKFKPRDDVRYGFYIDYSLDDDSCNLRAVEVNNEIYNTYTYKLNERENKSIKKILEEHCIKKLGKDIETIKCYELLREENNAISELESEEEEIN